MQLIRNYSLKREIITVDSFDYRVCSLQDVQQYDPNDAEARDMGLTSSNWSLFGVVWPASRILAGEVGHLELVGKRVLEVGCGIGLASLVLHRLGTDITASDYHPRAREFLERNVRENGFSPLPFCQVDFERVNPLLGKFDLIVASDVLYQPHHPAGLARMLSSHTSDDARVIVVDPGRGNRADFTKHMIALGFLHHYRQFDEDLDDGGRCRGRIMHYRRRTANSAGTPELRLI